jgi:hypothetical protein
MVILSTLTPVVADVADPLTTTPAKFADVEVSAAPVNLTIQFESVTLRVLAPSK